MKKNEGILLGAAIAAGLVGTLATLLIPKKQQPKSWADHVRLLTNSLVEKEDRTKKNVMIGSIAGGLIGVASALLYAQQNGVDLVQKIVKPFNKEVRKTVKAAKKEVKAVAKKAKSTVRAAKKKGKELKVETLKSFG